MTGGNSMEIKDDIRSFLKKFIGEHEVNDDDNIFDKGFVNSLFAMQLVSFIESEYDIALSNEDLDITNFSSINAIEALVRLRMNGE